MKSACFDLVFGAEVLKLTGVVKNIPKQNDKKQTPPTTPALLGIFLNLGDIAHKRKSQQLLRLPSPTINPIMKKRGKYKGLFNELPLFAACQTIKEPKQVK